MADMGDEIVVGMSVNSAGVQAGNDAAIVSFKELQAAVLALADTVKVAADQMAASSAGYAEARAANTAYMTSVTELRGAMAEAGEQATVMRAQMGAGGLSGAMSELTTGVGGAIDNVKTLFTTLAGLFVISEAIGWFDQLAQSIRNAAQEIFNLNVTTERFRFMWQYQYARGSQPDPQMAEQIAAWSYKFSYQAPFTRQDIMAGIGGLAPTGLNIKGLERFAPLIADLASTHTSVFSGGGSQLTFSQVALAVMEAMTTGNARRMLMELQIQPRQLERYGVKFAGQGHLGGQILNPWQFLPALEQYSHDKGWQGAAQAAAHETFWGERSSFIDRLQNLGLQFGGMNPDASVRPGSMFATIKKGMEDLSAWIDQHQQQLMNFANTIGDRGIGGALGAMRHGLDLVGQGLQQSGLAQMLQQWFGANGAPTMPGRPTRGGNESLKQYEQDLKNYANAMKDYNTQLAKYNELQYQATMPQIAHLPHETAAHYQIRQQAAGRLQDKQLALHPQQEDQIPFLQKLGKLAGDVAAKIKELFDRYEQFYNQFIKPDLLDALNQLKQGWDDFTNSLSDEDKQNLKEFAQLIGGLALKAMTLMLPLRLLAGLLHDLARAMDFVHAAQQFQHSIVSGITGAFNALKKLLEHDINYWKALGITYGASLMQGIIAGIQAGVPGLNAILGSLGVSTSSSNGGRTTSLRNARSAAVNPALAPGGLHIFGQFGPL